MAAFTRLFREGCGAHLCILLWPHWIVGVIFPLLIGISSYTPLTATCLVAVTCVLPYTYWIVKLNCRAEDENENYRTMPCCSCLCKDNHRKNLERSIICKHVVDGGEEDDDEGEGEDEEDGVVEVNNILQPATSTENQESENALVSYRSKHPKSDIVKKRKKGSAAAKKNKNKITSSNDDSGSVGDGDGGICDDSTKSQKGSANATQALSIHQGLSQGLSFPVALPDDHDHDEETPCIRGEEKEEDNSQSEQMCSICLEEYKVGDAIAWSRNDECHHAFHKDCIIEWLVNHQNCPICRKKY